MKERGGRLGTVNDLAIAIEAELLTEPRMPDPYDDGQCIHRVCRNEVGSESYDIELLRNIFSITHVEHGYMATGYNNWNRLMWMYNCSEGKIWFLICDIWMMCDTIDPVIAAVHIGFCAIFTVLHQPVVYELLL